MFKKPLPRNALALVEQQVRKWKNQEKEDSLRAEKGPWPLITMSREFGSLGAMVAQRSAQILGFSFWDQELVHAIAKETGAQEALLMSLDEASRSHIEDYINEALVGALSTTIEYVRQVTRVVRSIARHGSAVVVGRGSQFILEKTAALRVRAVCPFEMRVSGYAKRKGLSLQEAERQVREVERDRQSFIRRHYGREVGEPIHYDLVINTGTLSVEIAAATVVAAYCAKFGEPPNAES